jgi:hypothetical protein
MKRRDDRSVHIDYINVTEGDRAKGEERSTSSRENREPPTMKITTNAFTTENRARLKTLGKGGRTAGASMQMGSAGEATGKA